MSGDRQRVGTKYIKNLTEEVSDDTAQAKVNYQPHWHGERRRSLPQSTQSQFGEVIQLAVITSVLVSVCVLVWSIRGSSLFGAAGAVFLFLLLSRLRRLTLYDVVTNTKSHNSLWH